MQRVRSQLAALRHVEEQHQEAQERVQQLVAEMAVLRTRNEQLKAEMAPLRQKIALLQTAETATCPLCSQQLSEGHRVELLAQFKAEGTVKGDRYRANTAQARDLKGDEVELLQEMARLASELQQQPCLQRREATLAQQRAEAQIAALERIAQREALTVIEQRLGAQDHAPQERLALAQLGAEIEALGYNRAAHEKVRAEVSRLSEFQQRYQQLAIASKRLEEELVSLQ